MSDNINIGPKIVLEGEKEYRKALADCNTSMKVLKSELKAVSAEYDGNANSLDALRTKNDVLTKQQEEQDKKLKLLRGALEATTKQYGENSKQAQKWQIDLNNAYSELSKIDKELEENKKHMKEAEKSTDKTAKSIDEFGKEVKEAKEQTSTFGDVLKANLTGAAIVSGIKTLANGMKEIVSSTAEFRSDFSKLQTNADNAGASISGVSKELKNLDAITHETDSNIEALSNLLEAGFKGNSLTQAVEALSGAVIKFPDTLKIESLSDALQETLATGKATGQFGELLERLGYNLDSFNTQMEKTTSYTERQQYALDTLANTGLSKVNEEYVKNNQTMIEYYNSQYELREVMSEIAVAVTPLLTKSMSVLADNMDEITESALPILINSFTWMVENVDKIEAGLKGIGAALITKKAADGIVFAVNAYKTLTTATEAATTAQTAFNVATKASVIGVIASVVVGVGTALYSYAKNAKDAEEETKKLVYTTQELIDKSKELREEIDNKNSGWKEETSSIEANYKAMEMLTDKLYTLAEKENKTNSEKRTMVSLVNQLNEKIPGLNLLINEQTGSLNLQNEELTKLIANEKEYYLVRAAEKNYMTIAEQKVTAELRLNEILKERGNLNYRLQQLQYSLANYETSNSGNIFYNSNKAVINSTKESIETVRASIKAIDDEIQVLESTIEDSNKKWEENEKYIKQFSSDFVTQATSGNSVDLLKEIYAKSEKELDKNLKNEKRSFEKAQKEKIDAVKNSSKKELEILEENHKQKLDLISEEYIEKMKNVDEDRYNELKAVQDQIDALDYQTQAEDRAIKLRQEAEKKAELELKIATAETAEEKIKVQKELADYEEEVAKERIRSERELQVDILEEQKKTINDSYDAKIETLEAAQKTEQEIITNSYKKEKEAIEERQELKLEELKELQRLESESFDERQQEYKNYLREQKELTIQNAKDTYEEDLKLFKLSNALKYDEDASYEQKMKEIMYQYANEQMDKKTNVPSALKILQSDNVNEMIKYYNPSANTNSNLTATIDELTIERITKSVVESVMENMNLTVEMDHRQVGAIIDRRVVNSIR